MSEEERLNGAVRLTGRETEVLRLIARGCTYSQVADRLGMSAHTVASHIKNSYRKLDVHCAAAAVMRAVELRLLGEAESAQMGTYPISHVPQLAKIA